MIGNKKKQEACTPKMMEDIRDKVEKVIGNKVKVYVTPGIRGKTLVKNTGPIVELDTYRTIFGKIMYYSTKIAPEVCNAVRELAGHLSNPGA
jgi:hypothetical protein